MKATKKLRTAILKHVPRLLDEYYKDGSDGDWWNSVNIGDACYDINIFDAEWHGRSGKIKVSAYRVSNISGYRHQRHIPIGIYDERIMNFK